MNEETESNVKEETESKADKFGRILTCVLEVGAFVFFGALAIITGTATEPIYRDEEPAVDPDEELRRAGYDKVGKDVWYDRDGKRREKGHLAQKEVLSQKEIRCVELTTHLIVYLHFCIFMLNKGTRWLDR